MLTTPVPATVPAYATVPVPAASTGSPGVPPRSAPRCPGSHGFGGGSNGRVTVGVPGSGHRNPPTGPTGGPAGSPTGGLAGTEPGTADADEATDTKKAADTRDTTDVK